MSKHIDVTNWEVAWLELLAEYERLNDERLAHHAEAAQVAMAGMPRAEVEGA